MLLVARSADGDAWENVVPGAVISPLVHVRQVAYGAGRYVLVGLGGTLGASPDSRAWTLSTAYDFSIGHPRAVIHAAGRYVGHNLDSGIFVADDGLAWTTVVAGVKSNSIVSDVAWGNGTFVAVGPIQDSPPYGFVVRRGVIMTSPTGRTWRKHAAATYAGLEKVAFGGGVFVAVGGKGGRILASADGVAWRNGAGGFPEVFVDVAHGNGCFVALGGVSNGRGGYGRWSLYRSADGIRWERTWTAADSEAAKGSLTFCGGRFVVFSRTGDRTLVSRDGRVWLPRAFTVEGKPLALSSLAHGNGLFVATATIVTSPVARANVIATSADLLNWRAVPNPEYDYHPVVFGYGQFARAVRRGERWFLISSRDGAAWTTRLQLTDRAASITPGRRAFLLTGGRDWIAQSDPFPY